LVFCNLYWRNTKESIKSEYEVPPFVEEVILLDFHPVEAILYEDARLRGQEQRMRILCNSPWLSDHDKKKFGHLGTLENVRHRLLQKALMRPQYYEEKIPRLEAAVTEAQRNLDETKRNVQAESFWSSTHSITIDASQLITAKNKLRRANDAKLRWAKLLPKIEAIDTASQQDELIDISTASRAIVPKPVAGIHSLQKTPAKMTVTELKKELKKRDLSQEGKKSRIT